MTMAKKQTGTRTEASASAPNPEKRISARKTLGLESQKEAAGSAGTNQNALSSAVSNREKIALPAYAYWMQRGCQGGSPEEDWFRAEREIYSAPSSPFAGD
jgi:hypothetical protein